MVADQQIVTIQPDGTISGLQRKPGKGLDLRSLGGVAEIVRVSEIVWSTPKQRWFIVFREGPLKDKIATHGMLGSATGDYTIDGVNMEMDIANKNLLFVDYDDAVKVEIAILDGFRKQGMF